MTLERQVYLLNPRQLSPETIAVAFAKTSRSPESFREIAADLTDHDSAEFHEKWVVGYGHASVAEHAVLHIAVENLSRLAVEALESSRLASYTEKSTRYQRWDPQAFYIPAELDGHPLRERYLRTCQALFTAYQEALPPLRALVARAHPPKPKELEAAWDRRIRSRYVDAARYLLPAASLANVGMTANARVLEQSISRLLTSPLAEVRALGEEIQRVAQAETPTLVKYANRIPYLEQVRADYAARAAEAAGSAVEGSCDWCRLVRWDADGEQRVLAAALVRFGGLDLRAAEAAVAGLDLAEQAALADQLLGGMGPHDVPVRELEYANLLFEVVLDQGAYFELKRHRMMTQTAQALTADLGYATPRAFEQAGIAGAYRQAMDAAAEMYTELKAWNPAVASYVVPNGFNRRVLLQFNLRTAFHLVALRSAGNAHFAMRRVAQRLAEQIRQVYPNLGRFLRANPAETWPEIEAEHFA